MISAYKNVYISSPLLHTHTHTHTYILWYIDIYTAVVLHIYDVHNHSYHLSVTAFHGSVWQQNSSASAHAEQIKIWGHWTQSFHVRKAISWYYIYSLECSAITGPRWDPFWLVLDLSPILFILRCSGWKICAKVWRGECAEDWLKVMALNGLVTREGKEILKHMVWWEARSDCREEAMGKSRLEMTGRLMESESEAQCVWRDCKRQRRIMGRLRGETQQNWHLKWERFTAQTRWNNWDPRCIQLKRSHWQLVYCI